MLKGALAAAVTPLRGGGEALDEAPFGEYVEFLAAAGLDGILALGTTGEGILLGPDERRRAAGLFVAAAGDRLMWPSIAARRRRAKLSSLHDTPRRRAQLPSQ